MNITLFVLIAFILIVFNIIGFIGAVSPAIPGPPLCLISLVISYFYFPGEVSITVLVLMIVLCLLSTTIDYFAPMLVTKIGGGSKYAILGSTIGIIVGLFFPPFGIIWCPFVGAFIGEFLLNLKLGKAFKVAFLSFLSFLITTGFKLMLCAVIAFFALKPCFIIFK